MHPLGQVHQAEVGGEGPGEGQGCGRRQILQLCLELHLGVGCSVPPVDGGMTRRLDLLQQGRPTLLLQHLAQQLSQAFDVLAQRHIFVVVHTS